jgi:hypothetical protein
MRLSDGEYVNVKRSGYSEIIDPLFGLLKTPPAIAPTVRKALHSDSLSPKTQRAIARTDCSAPRSHKKDEGGPDKNSKNKPYG